MRVKCLAQEHNTMSPARTRTRTARSGDERTNHEALAPPTLHCRQQTKFGFMINSFNGYVSGLTFWVKV